jgi:translation initiation factor IF-1
MSPVENILLDALIVDVISDRAFRAELSNGHRLVAYLTGRGADGAAGRPMPGEKVQLSVSTFDLSKGRIVRRWQVQEEAGK